MSERDDTVYLRHIQDAIARLERILRELPDLD